MRKYCQESWRLSAYLDGELTAEQRAAVAAHVAGCPECAAALQGLEGVSAGLRGLEFPELSERALRHWHERAEAFSHRASARLAGWLYAVAAVLALASGMSLMRSTDTATVPASWEGEAVRISEDSPTAGSREAAIAEWMLTDLSPREARHE